MTVSGDLIAWCEAHLRDQQDRNARGFEREDALSELRGVLIAEARTLGQTTVSLSDADEMLEAADPELRARVRGLFARATNQPREKEETECLT